MVALDEGGDEVVVEEDLLCGGDVRPRRAEGRVAGLVVRKAGSLRLVEAGMMSEG